MRISLSKTQSSRLCNDYVCLGALLSVSLLISIVVSHALPYYSQEEYTIPAMEMARTGHILYNWVNFLPIGYPTVLALGYKIFGSEAGFVAVNIAISLLMLTSAWLFLRLTGFSVKVTLFAVTVLSLYPDFVMSYNKTQDTNITALALFLFMSATVVLGRHEDGLGVADYLVAASIAFAALIRPNLLLLLPVSWLLLYRSKKPFAIGRAIIQLQVTLFLYCSITFLVHGSWFFPRNGPYNLYAGYNPHTIDYMWNEEDSIPVDLQSSHVQFSDLRDPKMDPIYTRLALSFIHEHPLQAVKLDALKFVDIMLPDFHTHPANTIPGVLKIFCALGIPLWLLVVLPSSTVRYYDARWLIASVLIAVLLPFCLIISTQRFRIPLDFICWVDLGAVVFARLTQPGASKARQAGRSLYSTSSSQ